MISGGGIHLRDRGLGTPFAHHGLNAFEFGVSRADGSLGLFGAVVIDDFDVPDGAHGGLLDAEEVVAFGVYGEGGEAEGEEGADSGEGEERSGEEEGLHGSEGGSTWGAMREWGPHILMYNA
jgi:hypothetical protein